ncbi:DnaJ-domain-containing protein [Corynespora cassiicola Philippines]|uniref:DnaJ-domain-containing protein n=1 Tax=Corynespora cassiicola Philippines TaxID=1448308 RepID=A0A2T2NRH1_CORCC|nr:DnaJ-domain-containing protein [Corynespora cassiicola Philippines]
MSDPLPPDPYKALGVPKDAEAALIKQTYRKLVLKCHPDKVTDESLKQQKREEFDRIQQAYELIGDEEKRARYDAEVKLDQLRKEKFARTSTTTHNTPESKSYGVRTAAPQGSTPFSAPSSSQRYEERKPARAHDDDRYYDTRKFDTYEAYPKHTTSSRSARTEREPIKVTRYTTDRTRSEHKKTRDREERRERGAKFVAPEEGYSSDEKARYEAEYKRRSEEARRREDDEAIRQQAAAARAQAETQRKNYERQRKETEQMDDALRYIRSSNRDAETRPSTSRTTSSRDVRPEYYEKASSSRRDRPEPVRRSSARPKDRQSSSVRGERDRKVIPEIVEWESPPPFKHSNSSPADLHAARTAPQRSYTDAHRRTETSPSPMFRRSETMPAPHSSSRRKETTSSRPSGLRSSETASPRERESSSADKSFPTIPPPQPTQPPSTTKYYYPTQNGGVTLRAEDVGVANGHRTVLREPGRRARSPSPLSKPPMGANRQTANTSAKYTTTAPKETMAPPPLGRAATTNVSPSRDERGRQRLYGEVTPDYNRRENGRRQTSFSPDKISYARRDFAPEDIAYSASRGRDRLDRDREYASKPTLGRTATYVY